MNSTHTEHPTGVDGLHMLHEGCTSADIVAALTSADGGSDHRQLHLIDRDGHPAAFTGSACVDWSGDIAGPLVFVAGNMLAGPQVIEDTLRAYLDALHLDFDQRLIVVMEAGERAGGDKRGRQSCGIRIWSEAPFPASDLRVDDGRAMLLPRRLTGKQPTRRRNRGHASQAQTRPDRDRGAGRRRSRSVRSRSP